MINNREVLLSEEDFDLYERAITISKTHPQSKTRYASTWLDKKNAYIHRVVMARVLNRTLLRSERVDHINGNGLDNRRENLRVCTHAQNMRNQNRVVNATSKYKGVSFYRGWWHSRLTYNYKSVYIGKYDNEYDAMLAYNEKANELFGEYAKLNPIEGGKL